MASAQARKAAAEARGVERPISDNPTNADDLDDDVVQEKIADEVENGEKLVKIGGKEVRLYPLALRYAKKLVGLTMKIMQDSSNALQSFDMGDETRRTVTSAMRIAAIINEDYPEKFLPLVVHASQPPGTYSQATAVALAEPMQDVITYPETATVFYTMLEQNAVLKTIGIDPKAIEEAAKTKKRPS
jgi:hypothetical protein